MSDIEIDYVFAGVSYHYKGNNFFLFRYIGLMKIFVVVKIFANMG